MSTARTIRMAAQDASAIVLTGGKSSRMGRSKAHLPFDGEPLIVRIVRRLRRIFDDIVVVARPDQELPPLPATLVYDEVSNQGPVGGLVYGLDTARGAVAFVTACDSAFLQIPLVTHLLALSNGYDVVVPRWEQRLQPLHAVYRRDVLPRLREQLAAKRLRPVFLFEQVRTREVAEAELKRLDPEGLSFLNLNTPDDYLAALGEC